MKVDEFVGVNRIDQGQGGNLMVHGWPIGQCVVSDHDKAILRELGLRLRALAERPYEQEKKALWTAHNDLKTEQPVIFIDCENGWNEIFPWDKTIECEGEMAADWEMWLRKEIYWAEVMKDDKVVEAKLYLPYHAVDTGWGIAEERIGDPTKGEAYVWKSPLAELDEDEFEELDVSSLIKTPEIHVDWEASNAAFHAAEEVVARSVPVLFQPARHGKHDVRLLRLPGQGARNDAPVYRWLPRKV